MTIRFELADYLDRRQATEISSLLNQYASEPLGGGKPLPQHVMANLCAELAKRPYAFSLLAYDDDVAVGLANCFETFSTFACRPLLNIHDLVIRAEYRGRGLGSALLAEIQREAIERGCCKITLEVLEGNTPAKGLYESVGFRQASYAPGAGGALFMTRELG